MSTFLYAPGVRMFIKTERNGTIDITDDLVSGTLMRRSDGISTLNFSLQNARRKYDGVFTPNDTIIVEMKRIHWVRVFTGYLNSVPLVTAWPRAVSFSASCSLKRLQYWYWDPNLANVIAQMDAAISNGQGTADAGITNTVLMLLKNVVGWDESKAHIGAIPQNWFQLVMPYAKTLAGELAAADSYTQQYLNTLGLGSVGGVTPGAGSADVVNQDGSGGGYIGTITSKGILAANPNLQNLQNGVFQSTADIPRCLNNAEIIYRVGKQMGMSNNEIVSALTIAIHESHLIESGPRVDFKTSDSVGLFQMQLKDARPGVTQAMLDTAAGASEDYFTRLGNSGSGKSAAQRARTRQGWGIKQMIDVAQGISGLSFTPPVDHWVNEATVIFNTALNLIGNGAAPSSAKPTGKGTGEKPATQTSTTADTAAAPAAGSIPTGYDVVLEGYTLLTAGWNKIPYNRNGADSLAVVKQSSPPASGVGCSPWVSAILYNTPGIKMPKAWDSFWDTTPSMLGWLISVGAQQVRDFGVALQTQGCLCIKNGHVEISTGTGTSTLGSESPTFGGPQITHYKDGHDNYNHFTHFFLLPFVDYTNARNGTPPPVTGATGYQGSVLVTGPQTSYSVTKDNPGYNPDSSIDLLFGNQVAATQGTTYDTALAESLNGPRALLNDQPFLPYIMNLLHSSMRSFCSAPNGDLMAWFPDYYGIWGTAAKMTIEPIELTDFYVEWADDSFVTHQYTTGGQFNEFDVAQGDISTTFAQALTTDLRVMTIGIATIDIPALMLSVFGQELTGPNGEQFNTWIYKKFGARPDYEQVEGIIGPSAELFSALFFFMRQWAYQYNANIPMTFMPELYPGMLIQIPEYDFQAYVTAVTHNFQFGQGGAFTTTVNVAAPARMPGAKGDLSHVLLGMPEAAGFSFNGKTT